MVESQLPFPSATPELGSSGQALSQRCEHGPQLGLGLFTRPKPVYSVYSRGIIGMPHHDPRPAHEVDGAVSSSICPVEGGGCGGLIFGYRVRGELHGDGESETRAFGMLRVIEAEAGHRGSLAEDKARSPQSPC